MFCIKCGAKVPEGSAFCIKCGAKLIPLTVDSEPDDKTEEVVETKKAEAEQPVTIETEIVEDTANEDGEESAEITEAVETPPTANNDPEKPKRENKKGTIALIAVGLILVAAVAFALTFFFGPKKISYFKGANIVVEGANGYGRARIDYGDNVPEEYSIIEMLENEAQYAGTQEAISKYMAMSAMSDSVTCEWSGENTGLKNGDKLTYACTYNSDLSKYTGYKYKDLKLTYTVSGLEDPHEEDLFAGITAEWVYDGYGYTLKVDGIPAKYENINYYADDNEKDGYITMRIGQSEEELLEMGIIPLNGDVEAKIKSGYKPKTVKSADMSNKAIANAVNEAIGREVNKCGSVLYSFDGQYLIYDWEVLSSSYSDYYGLRVDYVVNTDRGSRISRTTYINLFKTHDDVIYDNTDFVPENVGCSVYYGRWTND